MTRSILAKQWGRGHREDNLDLHPNDLCDSLYHNLLRAVHAWVMLRTDSSAGSNNPRLGGTRCMLVGLFGYGFNANGKGPK